MPDRLETDVKLTETIFSPADFTSVSTRPKLKKVFFLFGVWNVL